MQNVEIKNFLNLPVPCTGYSVDPILNKGVVLVV